MQLTIAQNDETAAKDNLATFVTELADAESRYQKMLDEQKIQDQIDELFTKIDNYQSSINTVWNDYDQIWNQYE